MISVVIPTYNREKEILRSVESVRKQTVKDLEIIVVDDGSTDLTEEVIKRIDDSRIQYIKHKTNLGGCAARNTGVSNAHGKYIAFQDSDDVWYENKLEVEMNSLLTNNADIVFCKMNKIVNGEPVAVVPRNYSEGFLKPDSNVFGIGTPTLLGKAEVFKDNAFDETLPRFQELELLMRLSTKYNIYCCDKPLMDNYYDDSIKATSGNPHKMLDATRIIHKKYPYMNQQYPEMGERFARTLLIQASRKDIDRVLRKELRQMAVRIDPSIKTKIKYLSAIIGVFPLLNQEAGEIRGRHR